MSWRDFLKSIRADEEEELKRQQEGGFMNRYRGLIDDAIDVGGRTVKNVANYQAENMKNAVGTVAGAARELVVRPAVSVGMTLREGQLDSNTKLIKDYQEILKIPQEEREKEASEAKTDRGFWLSRFKEKNGSIDDQSIQKKIDELSGEQKDQDRGVFKIKDDKLNRIVFGNEDIHSYPSSIRIGKEATGNSAGGFAYGAGLAALDAPGVGGIGKGVKTIGKEGLELLAKANADDAVKAILKQASKLGDDVIDEIAPRIAQITDTKQIQSVIDTAARVAKEGSDKTKSLVDEYARFLKQFDDNAKGGMLQKTDDGYVRTTEHSKFYSDYYTANKRKPSKEAWREEAERQLKNGKAESTFQDEFAAATASRTTPSDVLDVQDEVRKLVAAGDVSTARELNSSLDNYKLPDSEFIVKSAPPIEKTDPLQAATDAAAQTQKVIDERRVSEGAQAMESIGNKMAPTLKTTDILQPEARQAMDELTTRAASTPQPAGTTRVYQVNPVNGEKSEWVFTDAEMLGKFVDGKKGADNVVEFFDVPTSELQAVPGKPDGVMQITSRIPKDEPLADGVGYNPGTKIDLRTGQVTEPTDQFMDAMAPVKQVADETPQTLDEVADAAADEGFGVAGKDARQEILDLIKTGDEVEKMGKKRFRDRAYQQFFDKLDPIKKMVKNAEEKAGETLDAKDNPYAMMRLYASLPNQIKLKTDEFVQALDGVKKAGATLDDVRALGLARRVVGRSDIDFTISRGTAQAAIDQLKSQLGPEKFAAVSKAVDDIVAYNDSLVEMLVDAGVMSRKAVDAMHAANPDYFARMQAVNKLLEKGDAAFRNGRTFNLSKQNVIKEMKGMERGTEILDPIESIIKATELTMRTAHRNRVFQSMQKLSELDPETVVKIADPEDVAERISLSMKNKEMRPVRDKLLKLSKTRAKTIRRLQSEVNKLNKQGLHISLKTGEGSGTTVDNVPFTVSGLGGRVPTSKSADKLGPRDTARFVKSLIEGPNRDLVKIKKMLAKRDPKLASMMDEFIEIKADYEDVAEAIRKNVKKAQELADAEVPEGYKIISGFGGGYKGRLAIPEELAEVYSGMTQKEMDLMTGFISSLNRVMKTSVTTLSLPFAFIRNPIRDFKAMASNSENIPPKFRKVIGAWVEGFAHAAKRDDVYKQWIKAGGGGSGIYDDIGDPAKLVKTISRDIKKPSFGEVVTSPKELAMVLPRLVGKGVRGVQKAGATLEAAPRIAEFQAALKNNLSDEGAALAARNVTVDFHQSGTVGQVMNHWVPFLNARLQGNKKLYEAAKRNPARFMKMYAGLTMAPIVGTAVLNSRYPDVMAQIDQQTKDNNFVIVLGDGQNEEGDYTQVIKIPKGDIDKILGNPLENFVTFALGQDAKAFDDMFMDSLSSASPVDFVKEGEINPSRAAGAVLPVALKVPLEGATNHNFYYDNEIVPRSMENLPERLQKRDSTSQIDQLLGSMFGVAPLKAEAARKGLTGSLFSGPPTEGLSNAVVGASNNRPVNEFYNTYNSIQANKNEVNAKINESLSRGDLPTARALADDYNKQMIQDLLPWFKRYSKYITEEDKKNIEEKMNSLQINLSNQSLSRRVQSLVK